VCAPEVSEPLNPVLFPRPETATSRRLGAAPPPGPSTHHPRRYPRNTIRFGATVVLAAAATAVLVAAVPHTAHAAGPGPVVLAAESIEQVVDRIRLWLVGILAGWATLCLTVGFIRYTSGEPGEVEKGKTALRSAAIGYAGALLAPLLVTIVAGWVA
jgi:hypothetical protein